MADVSEFSVLIVTITFLSGYVILVGTIPTEFAAVAPDMQAINVPEEFSSIDIVHLAWWGNGTITEENGWDDPLLLQLPPGDPQIELEVAWQGDDWHLTFWRKTWWFFIPTGHYLYQSSAITDTSFEWDYVNSKYLEDQSLSAFQAYDPDGTVFYVYVSYNQSKYGSFQEAWDDHELSLLVGVGIEDSLTKLDAWGLISQIIMFQMPDVHWSINLLLAIPIYAAIALLVIIIVLKFIPFLGG